MQEMYKLEGTVLTVVLPQDVDHPVTDLVRRETDHIINQNYIRTIIFVLHIRNLWTVPGWGF